MNRTAVAKLAESNRLRAEAAKIQARADTLAAEAERELAPEAPDPPPVRDDSNGPPTEEELAAARKGLRRFGR